MTVAASLAFDVFWIVFCMYMVKDVRSIRRWSSNGSRVFCYGGTFAVLSAWIATLWYDLYKLGIVSP